MVRAVRRNRKARGAVVARRSTMGSFFSGLILGLGAPTFIGESQLRIPKYPVADADDDWHSVGDSLRAAISHFDEKLRRR